MEEKAAQQYLIDKHTLENALVLIQEAIFPNHTVKTVTAVLAALSKAKPVPSEPAKIH